MASVVKIKRSSIQGKAPTTSNLETGELALNLRDAKLFSSNGTSVFEVGSNLHSLSVGTGGLTIANGAIRLPTADGSSGQFLRTNGAGQLSFATVTGGGGGAVSSPADFKQFKFTAGEGDTVFEGTDDFGESFSFTSGNISVYLNGVLQATNTDFTTANTTSITFSEPVSNLDIVSVQSFEGVTEFVDVRASITSNSANGTTATTAVVADTFKLAQTRSAKYIVQVSNPNHGNQYQSTEVMLIHNGSATFMTEYATLVTSTAIANVSSDISGTDVRLIVTPSIANAEIKVVRTGVNV
jgi:hypothetical protein